MLNKVRSIKILNIILGTLRKRIELKLVKYNKKMHIFAMNGQTGEFIGNIPLDKGKTILYTILIFTITMAICIAVSYFIFMGGQ